MAGRAWAFLGHVRNNLPPSQTPQPVASRFPDCHPAGARLDSQHEDEAPPALRPVECNWAGPEPAAILPARAQTPPPLNAPPASEDRWDVLIVGGALAGGAAALLLRRRHPHLRILICEKSVAHGRRVGEATVEISTFFLSRVLGLTRHLNEAHLLKQGMRFWFANDRARTLADCSEIGGRYQVRLPSYQLDRSVIDEELLRQAQAAGAELLRPAGVGTITLQPGGDQVVQLRHNGQSREVRARWVIDASGVAAVLARQQGWWRPNEAHPTAAVWARWKGVKDWDDPALARQHPEWSRACLGLRNTATNHLTGDGWWAWWIPLKGGDVSIGVVFDQRLVRWPEHGPPGERLKTFLCRHPVGRELLADAHWIEGDVLSRKNLAYHSTTFAGDGFALVGDAAAFLDPLYSPGMDWLAYTVTATVELIDAQVRGEPLAPRLAAHNRSFARSYQRWFEAIYRDKYEYLGEFDLVRLAFLLDLGLYYLGVVSQPYKRGPRALAEPVFSTAPSVPFFHLIRAYNRRLARIARARRERGALGRRNAHRRFLFPGYTISPGSGLPVLKAFAGWIALELVEGWRSWWPSRRRPAPAAGHSLPAPLPAQSAAEP
jgi:flavin-dependent dehydrogenase